MNRLHRQHWMLAFLLALATHLAVYLFSITLPGGEPVYRGGAFSQDGALSPGAAGIFVQLGKSSESSGETPGKAALKEEAPAQTARVTLAQAFVAGEGEPGSGAEETEPPEPPEPVGKSAPATIVSANSSSAISSD